MEALWKPPAAPDERKDGKPEDHQLSSLEQSEADAVSEKTRYPAYEVLVRVVISSNTATRSQVLLKNVIAAFSMFDSARNNGFKFSLSRNIEKLTTAYIMRFFPQQVQDNILNSVEMATLFHLPGASAIPTSQVKRQMSKQVDGPTDTMDEGVLIGYNEFRGTKKPIRIAKKDRRRHVYIIGQTGVGKSVLQENMAYQDMMDGRGFAFIDPHGDLVESLLGKVPKERVEDIIISTRLIWIIRSGSICLNLTRQTRRTFWCRRRSICCTGYTTQDILVSWGRGWSIFSVTVHCC